MDETLIASGVETIVGEVISAGRMAAGQLLIIGASTSEVAGARIGTSGSLGIASAIYRGVQAAIEGTGVQAAFQCCEHLNRAVVIDRETAERYGFEEVSVIPVPKAGGAMAAYAYRQLGNPCMVESVQAHAGIDIGDTLIGMQLRRVAVPYRPSLRQVGAAHVNAAITRPRLVGGQRAVYTAEAAGAAFGAAGPSDC